MKSRFKINGPESKFVEIDHAKEANVAKIVERKVVDEFDNVQGTVHEILLHQVKVLYREQTLATPIQMEVEHDFPLFKIHFELEGKSTYIPEDKTEKEVIVEGGMYNFFFLPKVKGTLLYDTQNRKSVEIFFTLAYLKNIFKEHLEEVSTDFGNALKKNCTFLMFDTSQPIPATLSLIINEIISCTYDKEIKQVFIQSKINEIFSFLFTEIKNKKRERPVQIKTQEYSQILEAEKILVQNLETPPTIQQLSEQVGINQFKLKTQFKLIFKEPIFSYVSNMRMEKAKKMLIEEDLTVSEVAYAVGYKNPQHFTVAFKKKYKYLPSSLKQKQSVVTDL